MSLDGTQPDVAQTWTVEEFFARALAIEIEASERYTLLAEQMEVHNNREIAGIFRKMAQVESEHRDEIARRAGDAKIDGLKAKFSWTGPAGPEEVDFEAVHYLMTPHQALQLARINEERAVAFFETIAGTALDPKVRAFAAEMADDERQHVVWVDEWIARFGPEDPGRIEDPDPPVYSE
jgi:rubrerythrin